MCAARYQFGVLWCVTHPYHSPKGKSTSPGRFASSASMDVDWVASALLLFLFLGSNSDLSFDQNTRGDWFGSVW